MVFLVSMARLVTGNLSGASLDALNRRPISFLSPMRLRSLPLSVGLLLAGLGGGMVARAEAQIATKSPFLPPTAAAAAPAPTAPLEFRGMIETEDGMLYRVYDPARKAGAWALANEKNTELGVIVKQYDAERGLTLEYEGRLLTLPEKQYKVVSTGTPIVAPAPVPIANVMPMMPQTAVNLNANAANPTEQQRLEAVAAEVARRRALREQAAPGVAVGAAPVGIPVTRPLQQNLVVPGTARGVQPQNYIPANAARGRAGVRQQR